MEAFSLLRYWKSSSSLGTAKLSEFRSSAPTTIVAAVGSDSSDEDDGPFFDLEFAVPSEEEEEKEEERQKVEQREIDEEEMECNLNFSPQSDEFRFDGSDSAPLADMEQILSSAAASSAGSSGLAKSAAKVRVFMLGLKRSKSESKQITQENNRGKNKSKLMTVRLKMEELKVPKISLLTRASSNTVKSTQTDEKLVTESSENNETEKKDKNNKEVVQKYLKLVRPLYVKVSKKTSNDTAEAMAETETIMTVKSSKQRFNLKKHLGKSKSAVVHSLPRSSGNNGNGNGNGKSKSTKKVDDSLLQQQDGIQSAILHCKRSFNSSSSSQEEDDETKLVLMRSASDPSYEKFTVEAEARAEENE